jgi:hypothetical protein
MKLLNKVHGLRFFKCSDCFLSYGDRPHQCHELQGGWILLEPINGDPIFSSNRKQHLENSGNRYGYQKISEFLSNSSPVDSQSETGFLCFDHFNRGNVSHELLDHSYRAWLAGKTFGSPESFLFSSTTWQSSKEVIEYMHGGDSLISFLEPWRRYRFKNLVFASTSFFRSPKIAPFENAFEYFHMKSGRVSGLYLQDLRRSIREVYANRGGSFDGSLYHSGIFVSRKAGSKRQFKNHEEILDVAKSRGLAIILLEDIPSDMHFRPFMDTNLIAGFHGAGMAHIVSCEDRSVVLELFSENGTKSIERVASTMGLEYFRCDNRFESDNLVLSPEKFAKSLDMAINAGLRNSRPDRDSFYMH